MHFTHLTDRALALVRRVFSIGCAAMLFSALAFAAEPVGFGSHGMAVFGGRDGLYASHLPMFHAPHDTQVLLRFHLADPRVDASLRARLALRPQLWTLDPEHFDLHRLQPGHEQPLKQFNARFVQGHFERGGVQRFAGQTVVVDEVLLFKPLDFTPAIDSQVARSAGSYLLLGAGREFFAVKEIDRRPDFDTIVAMKPLPHAKQPKSDGGQARTQIRRFLLPTDDLKAPTRPSLQTALQAQVGGALQVGKTLYFETEDLK
ncbi:hypothetical protein HZ993_00725 [Rhodoferax sp. AJA081-3]|uniref:hypothetical protein n=1 Tax=Rhodoferax sp. AJA081-3 TaxID=2752316 RepID=UPI001ADF0562|nr:hypothetical protein [Rhodoferax sp. AJA081-3]QTN28417.1 hypothetical protein HZ993_00725 [Rhodoferax sp. AJA081-3]